jgi:putative membrane-bound dehydrogenase-like protein
MALVIVMGVMAGPGQARGRAGDFKLGDRTLNVPEGFSVELVAGPPVVDRPITVAFDEKGRLYVADSSGSNDNVQKQLAERPHRVIQLEDRDGDGRYDTRTIFADKMMFPEGTLWHDGSLYVSAPPSIWKLTDTDGDGVADRRVEWFQGKTLTGCANDLHGPYLGPDGWIYWCKGAFAQQTHARPGKKPLITRAAHIFRCRPDGTGIEPVLTGGMDNPVDVTFTPGGERILTCTFFQHPGGGKRDGLIHAIYGGIYGKVHGPIFEPAHKWTGPEVMPVLLHMGPAAPCGLSRFESSSFGPEYRDSLFACYFNLHKVSRHVLTKSGASFTTKDEDFVTSPDLDFHPTDVIEDADGSLIVVDTGGWYKLCCPSSQLHKPDVLGGVYRVRRKGSPRFDDPRGLKLAWTSMSVPDLANLLDDPRTVIRQRAIHALSQKGQTAVVALTSVMAKDRSVVARTNAVWTAARIDQPTARVMICAALSDPDETVRQAAAHAASLHRIAEASSMLAQILHNPSLHNRRVAAEALGRIGNRSEVPEILKALGEVTGTDRVLEHSLTYALIEIGDPQGTAKGLKSPDARVKRAALTALDQMEGGGLDPRMVAALLAEADPSLKDTASWIIGRHPEWAGALAGIYRNRLIKGGLTPADQADLERQLARSSSAPEIQRLLSECLADSTISTSTKLSSLRAMAQSGLKDAPVSWIDQLANLLGADNGELTSQAVSTARALALSPDKSGSLVSRLLAVANTTHAPAQLRLAALSAIPGAHRQLDQTHFAFLVSQLHREQPASARSAATDVLARANLAPAQLGALADTLKTVGPLELDRLLTAFEQSTDEALGLKLVQLLGDSSAQSSLRVDALKQHLAKYGPSVQRAAEKLYARLNADSARQKVRIDELLTGISRGDIRRGQLVFHSEKAACYACHAIGYRGGNIGPDLTKVGQIRSERDLLEAIVYPSVSLIRSYEPVVVATANGKVVNGLIRDETSQEVLLVTGANQEARIARADIEEIRPSSVSIMPAGLDQQLTTQELADLVAFLKACR